MKVCPECKATYPDDDAVCATDGHALVDAHAPVERTSVIDLEALEAERARKAAEERAAEEVRVAEEAKARAAAEAEEAARHEQEKTPPPTEAPPVDPDATGVFISPPGHGRARQRGRRAHPPTERELENDPVDDDEHLAADDEVTPVPRTHADGAPLRSRTRDGTKTGLSRTSRTAAGRSATAVTRPPPPSRSWPQLLGVVVIFVAVAGGSFSFFLARAKAVLTVTTVPPGAAVAVDGVALGPSPLQTRVSLGHHVVELTLDGYVPFKEVITVPSGGLPYLQPLRPLQTVPPTPSRAEVANGMVRSFEQLLVARDVAGARTILADFMKLVPDDERVVPLQKRLATAEKEAVEIDATNRARARLDALTQAKSAAHDGDELYRQGRTVEAEKKLLEAIRLDPRLAGPHRTLARIHQHRGDNDKVRYHLRRYLSLGGDDADFKVREWLEQHPGKE